MHCAGLSTQPLLATPHQRL
uniref:Uncharacterized protein n=1 Tax=Rhizophora mucronata TaxID=61149 RepID=A0A2P2PMT5_RHIMU